MQANIEARNNNYVNIARHLKFTRKQLLETQSETSKPDDQEEVRLSPEILLHTFLVLVQVSLIRLAPAPQHSMVVCQTLC